MQEYAAIAGTLRKILKTRKLTYDDLATRLGVSEQTVKRTFNGDDGPLSRLVEICQVAGVSFFDVVQMTATSPSESFELTEEQEQFLCDHPHVHAFFNKLRRSEAVSGIRSAHGLSEQATYRYLRALEKQGLLDMQDGERYTLRVKGSHSYRDRGPLWRKRWTAAITGLFGHLADAPDKGGPDSLWSQNATRLTADSLRKLNAEILDVVKRYRRIGQRESSLLADDELIDVMWAIGLAAPYKEAEAPLREDV